MKDPTQVPAQAEHDQLRAFLQAKGGKPAEVAAALGAAPAGRSRRALEQALTHWLKDRPKG